MDQSPNEPKKSYYNLLYFFNKENNNHHKNVQNSYKDPLYSLTNELINNNDIENNDERLIYEDLSSNHQQNNNNFNPYIFPSYESEEVELEGFNFKFPYDFKNLQNDNIPYEDIYTTKNDTKNTTKTKIKTNKNKFVISKKRNIDKNKSQQNRRKFHVDNIIKKIKVDYFHFIILFINLIIKEFTKKNNIIFDLKFYDLDNKYKINVTKDFIKLLQKQTIKDVIKTDISTQYTSKNKNSNLITCNKIEEEIKLKDIDDILNKKILYFFETIYFQKRKEKYNLKELNLIDLEITLDKEKIGLFEDLLDRNNINEDNFNFDEYKENMIKCCKNFFFQKTIFKTHMENDK